MEKSELTLLKRATLFGNISGTEIESMLSCLSAERKLYKKGEQIYRFGDVVDSLGMVISGSVDVVREDYWGNRNIISVFAPGESFAESYACAGTPLAVSVESESSSEVLLLDVHRILTVCSSVCSFHARLIQNLVALLAAKNLLINEKLGYVTQRNTREKLLSYLSAESQRQHSAGFDIPFNRQQLADYLSIDRSAMSNELSKMKHEGILDCDKKHFDLLRKIEV